MAFNRLAYDTCAYQKYLHQSVAPINYMLAPERFEHQHKCRNEFGLAAGPQTSHIQGNMVDLDSDLRGITRHATLCPQYKHAPQSNPNRIERTNYGSCSANIQIDTTPLHLQSCQMNSYSPIPSASFQEAYECPKKV